MIWQGAASSAHSQVSHLISVHFHPESNAMSGGLLLIEISLWPQQICVYIYIYIKSCGLYGVKVSGRVSVDWK